MTCVCRSFNLFRGMGTKHTRKFNLRHYSTSQADPVPQKVYSPSDRYAHKWRKQGMYGITELLGPTPQLLAGIKERWRHFHVHEIDPDGNRVQLTDLTPLPPGDHREPDKTFIHCTLFKQGLETSDALRLLRQQLILQNKGNYQHKITFAGRKDKEALTTQRICIRNLPGVSEQLPTFSIENLKIGNFNYASNILQLGQLKGNHFNILLNRLEFEESMDTEFNFDTCKSALDESIKNFRDNGFINYFGLQRFGRNSSNVGAAVLTSNYEKVFDLILLPRLPDSKDLTQLKDLWLSSRDPEKLLKLIPPEYHHTNIIEARLITGLAKHYQKGQGSLHKAYLEIPWFSRSIFLSSFISCIWNHVASYRIKHFGLGAIPGDYVYTGTSTDNRNIKMLTEEDLQSGQYSIYDVLLPVLGRTVTCYTNPSLQEFCTQLLTQHGLEPDCFEKSRLRDDLQAGFYRSLLVKPKNVTYRIIPSSQKNNLKQQMPSDLDLMEANQVTEGQGSTSSIEDVGKSGSKKKNKYCAIVDFDLPKSSYATMAFRELIQ